MQWMTEYEDMTDHERASEKKFFLGRAAKATESYRENLFKPSDPCGKIYEAN